MQNRFIVAGLFGLLAVGLGAFGAHGLKPLLDVEQLTIFKTGVQYQMSHALVLLALALYLEKSPNLWLNRAFTFISVGIVLFSGSLYLLSCHQLLGMTSWKWLGPITPLGGLSFIVGWAMVMMKGVNKTEK